MASYCVYVERTSDKHGKDQRIVYLIRTARLAHGIGSQGPGSGAACLSLKIAMLFDASVVQVATVEKEKLKEKLQPLVGVTPCVLAAGK